MNITTLNRHAPSKKKHARENQMLFLTKDWSKAIMTRSRLRVKFLNNKKEEIGLFMSNKGIIVSFLRKDKKMYYTLFL